MPRPTSTRRKAPWPIEDESNRIETTAFAPSSRAFSIMRSIACLRLLGANAVISMRFDSSEIGQQLTEIVAYGTAVVVTPT